MDKVKPVKIPSLKNKEKRTPKKEDFNYREIVKSLLYLSTKTRSDISSGVSYSNSYMENYNQENINDVKHIMKYLKGTPDHGIQYNKGGDLSFPQAYCDADFAGDELTRRSATGYIIFYKNAQIGWCSRRQPNIALSSTEAKYVATAKCCKKL
ncbi:uncharacterized mitochondrial protein AtMg00810-like [Monomorium pharaonis]|uniref:uncharacterized mitochondrial protein AtMg00810-like n=1 Tax=Monomorium pharaonis TaxID=307658 RepID=UPI00102E1C07|nr:uncharacterized mitochondrial protein AtMg00810-like [Monomorium pharaonis]